MPHLGHGIQAVFVHPVIVEEITAVAHVLVGEVTVRVVAEFREVIVGEGLFRAHLVGHPLGGLLPEVASLPLVVAEGHRVDVVGLLVQHQVTGHLILEGMADFVGHRGTAVRRLGIHPQAAGDIVGRAGPVGRPFRLVPQEDLELVPVQIGLVRLGKMGELQYVDIVSIDFFAPVQECFRVQMVGTRRLVRRRGAIVPVPENDEMLALPAAPEIVQARTLERVVERTRHVPVPRALVELGVHVDLFVVGHVGRFQVIGRRLIRLFRLLRLFRILLSLRHRRNPGLLLAAHDQEGTHNQGDQCGKSESLHGGQDKTGAGWEPAPERLSADYSTYFTWTLKGMPQHLP